MPLPGSEPAGQKWAWMCFRARVAKADWKESAFWQELGAILGKVWQQ